MPINNAIKVFKEIFLIQFDLKIDNVINKLVVIKSLYIVNT